MKHLQKLLIFAWMFGCSSALFGQEQITPVQIVPDERVGRIIVSEPQAKTIGLTSTPDRQKISQEIKNLLASFELLRDAYLKEQENLRKRERGATTEAERDRIRAIIKEARDAWLERERNLREEMKDRIAELRKDLPSRAEIFDNARDSLRESIATGRKRRGQD